MYTLGRGRLLRFAAPAGAGAPRVARRGRPGRRSAKNDDARAVDHAGGAERGAQIVVRSRDRAPTSIWRTRSRLRPMLLPMSAIVRASAPSRP